MDGDGRPKRLRPLVLLLVTTVTLTEGLTKNFVNQSMPELRPMFVVNFDMASVICQHSADPADLHMHDMSILCDGKTDCYSNPAMHDESFPYCVNFRETHRDAIFEGPPEFIKVLFVVFVVCLLLKSSGVVKHGGFRPRGDASFPPQTWEQSSGKKRARGKDQSSLQPKISLAQPGYWSYKMLSFSRKNHRFDNTEGHCNSTCSHRGACLFDGRKAQCYCNAGFHGPSCELEDVNECAEKRCHWMAHCQNTYGSYECTCFPGFQGDGYECTDIDECETGEAVCPEHAECVNLPGTYMCNCSEGFMPKGIPLERCADVDECETKMHGCEDGLFCENTIGSYSCVSHCSPGYSLTEGTCVDVDECEEGRCDKRATCENLPGSFKCRCDEGFTGDGRSCIPLADCSQDESICDRHAFCLGAFRTCLCQAGYKGDGLSCEDENECEAKNNPCENQTGKRCVNIEGGYICCDEQISDSECIKEKGVYCSGGCGLHAVCFNQTCRCMEGFTGDPMTKCYDVNECEEDVCPGVGSWCVNMIGGHVCCEAESTRPECRGVEILKTNAGNVVLQLNASQVKGKAKGTKEAYTVVTSEHGLLGGKTTLVKGGLFVRNGEVDLDTLRAKILAGIRNGNYKTQKKLMHPKTLNLQILGDSMGTASCERGCPEDSVCVDGICECRAGFTADPRLGCVDINECEEEGGAPCGHIRGAWCLNTLGSFHCCTPDSTMTDCIGLEISLKNGTVEITNAGGDELLPEDETHTTEGTETFGRWQNFSGGQIIIGKGKVKNWDDPDEPANKTRPGEDRWGIEISGEEPEKKRNRTKITAEIDIHGEHHPTKRPQPDHEDIITPPLLVSPGTTKEFLPVELVTTQRTRPPVTADLASPEEGATPEASQKSTVTPPRPGKDKEGGTSPDGTREPNEGNSTNAPDSGEGPKDSSDIGPSSRGTPKPGNSTGTPTTRKGGSLGEATSPSNKGPESSTSSPLVEGITSKNTISPGGNHGKEGIEITETDSSTIRPSSKGTSKKPLDGSRPTGGSGATGGPDSGRTTAGPLDGDGSTKK
uniref:EGF-like domain-containing protein n=1 Tax=Steinernema glaseri TaxID=37863 RepID=A0A1I8AFK9_9BILA